MIIYVFRFLTFWLFDDPELLVSNFPIVTIPFIFTFLVFFSVLKGKNAAISYFIRKLSGLNYKFWNFSPLKWASLVLWTSGGRWSWYQRRDSWDFYVWSVAGFVVSISIFAFKKRLSLLARKSVCFYQQKVSTNIMW